MTGSNHLNSHSGESSNRRADKMSPDPVYDNCTKTGKSVIKKRYGRKRRQFLNNPINWSKL